MVLGLVRAQRLLTPRPVFSELQVIEVMEPRALEIWHEFDMICRIAQDVAGALDLTRKVIRRDGAKRETAATRDPEWWQPVQIRVERRGGQKIIQFTTPTGRARVEASLIVFNETLVDLFTGEVGAALDGTPEDGTAGRVLFELLWPSALKDRSQEDHNLRLVLDAEMAALPWEMLDDLRPWQRPIGASSGEQRHRPPAVRTGAIRQLIRQQYRAQPQGVPVGSPRALVIGNPLVTNLPSLRGAEQEARDVERLLKNQGYHVKSFIGENAGPASVLKGLFAQAWNIIHIAAHGVVKHRFRQDGPEVTGVAWVMVLCSAPTSSRQCRFRRSWLSLTAVTLAWWTRRMRRNA